jgi:signal transduction histidine kinase
MPESRSHPPTDEARNLAAELDSSEDRFRLLVERTAELLEREQEARGEAERRAMQESATRLRQVVSNLLSYAIKYYSDGGRVVIRVEEVEEDGLRESHGWVCVHIEDTGPGIAPEKQRLLFQEFSCLHPLETSGAGIGLAMAQKVAHALGGKITLHFEPGHGSTFLL